MSRRRFMPTKGGRKDSRVIALTFTKPFGINTASTSCFSYDSDSEGHDLIKVFTSPTLNAKTTCSLQEKHTHTHTRQRRKWKKKMMLLSKWLSMEFLHIQHWHQLQRKKTVCRACKLTDLPQWVWSWTTRPLCWWPHRRRCPDPPWRDCWK